MPTQLTLFRLAWSQANHARTQIIGGGQNSPVLKDVLQRQRSGSQIDKMLFPGKRNRTSRLLP